MAIKKSAPPAPAPEPETPDVSDDAAAPEPTDEPKRDAAQLALMRERAAKAREALAAKKAQSGSGPPPSTVRKALSEQSRNVTIAELNVLKNELEARELEVRAREHDVEKRLTEARARLAAIRERKVPAIREDPVYAEAAPEDRPKVIHRLQEAARRDDPRLYIRTAYGDW